MMSQPPPAVNLIAYRMIKEDGYGRYAASLAKGLQRLGVRVWPNLVSFFEMPGWAQRAAGFNPGNITGSVMPPHHMLHIPGRQVNLSMYESLTLPKKWDGHANEKAVRVVVPAPFLVDVYKESGVTIPISVVPGGVDTQEFFPPPYVTDLPRPFTFGALGDRGSRKGWDIAWAAFCQAFAPNENVQFVVKCRPGGLDGLSRLRSHPKLSVWEEDAPSLSDFFSMIDCFVFPTRGEGWGLPPREAAAYEVPTICTAWGGTHDAACWAWPLTTYTYSYSNLEGEGLWVNPDVEEVAAQMRWIYEHRDEAHRQAQIKAQWLRNNQTWDHSARQLLDVLGGHRAQYQ